MHSKQIHFVCNFLFQFPKILAKKPKKKASFSGLLLRKTMTSECKIISLSHQLSHVKPYAMSAVYIRQSRKYVIYLLVHRAWWGIYSAFIYLFNCIFASDDEPSLKGLLFVLMVLWCPIYSMIIERYKVIFWYVTLNKNLRIKF